MKKQVRIIPLILLALVSSACSPGKEQPHPPADKRAQFQEEFTGEALFNERCRQCHAAKEQGGALGPDLSQAGSTRDARFLGQVIREPSKFYPGSVMPPYDTLSQKQVDSLVDYLGSLK